MHLHTLDYVLWLSAPIMQMGVLIAMYRRGIHREFPNFFNYTILQIAGEPVLIFLLGRQAYTLYYVAYWTNFGLSVLFSFAVLQEIFNSAFRPYQALRDLGVILFRWSALVVLLVAGMWAMTSGRTEQDTVKTTVFLVERSIRLMQCGLVFFLLLFSEYLGISRKNILFGIAIGFGLFASVSMLVAAGTSHASLPALVLRWAKSAAYDLACFIWLGYTALAPVRSGVAEATQRSKQWNSALEDVRVQPVPDSLLDSMDRTVERLLYPPEEVKANVVVGRH